MTEVEMKKIVRENILFYVYVIMDPKYPGNWEYEGHIFKFKPIYVGKGKGRRIHKHFNTFNSANIIKDRVLQKRKEEGYGKCYDFVFITEDECKALEKEFSLIKTIGRLCDTSGILTNLLDQAGSGAGRSPSEETRQKIREWNLSEANPLRGVPRTEEVKRKISESLKGIPKPKELIERLKIRNSGENSAWWGKQHTEETKKIQKRFNVTCRYEIQSSIGEIIVAYSLLRFCKEHNLNPAHLGRTFTGERNHHKGYKILLKEYLPDNWMETDYLLEYKQIEEYVMEEITYADAA